MRCRGCYTDLERPGDYCLTCDTPNADVVYVDLHESHAEVVVGLEGEIEAREHHRTHPEDADPARTVAARNYAYGIADDVRRRRPERVLVRRHGDVSDVVRYLRRALDYELENVRAGPREALSAADGPREVDVDPEDKVSGRHSTLIGGRRGRRALAVVADNPYVKKVVPGPIESSGRGRGFTAKLTRAGDDGNLRMLVRDGSSVQVNRVVTTADNREDGEHVADDVNAALSDELG
ncbi:MAG: DUF2103 domain-containing protein [Halobacteriales archaeon]